ncbi:MAG: MBL fold metallo-hydrolase [Rhodospirillum sp.]|nr:MBL fold metallo-hydrolase [Rhodospirillum sp.]MCF8488336.1 MBL fold metallo-hydrolase [Rhodospirillum sp.]MCF8500757.1 MBL fold metallo-hydrolase [Rhodospirillum sp.]
MQITFWGTRGSIAAPLSAKGVRDKIVDAVMAAAQAPEGAALAGRDKAEAFVDAMPFSQKGTFGGNTSCVEVETDQPDHFLICDLGTGVRELGLSALGRLGGRSGTFDVLLSHLHWDHIMGFPFFVPAYIPGHVIRIHGCHDQLEAALKAQQSAPCFPVPFGVLGATIEFHVLTPDQTTEIGGVSVTPSLQHHGNDSYGYRLERAGTCVVYSTDSEHGIEDEEDLHRFAKFFQGADLVIFDAMYSLADAATVKQDWGHSSNVMGVDLCHRAGVKRLALFHHEPVHGDGKLQVLLEQTLRYEALAREGDALEVIASYDGLVVTV